MNSGNNIQLSKIIKPDTGANYLKEALMILHHHYPRTMTSKIKKCSKLVAKLFEGKFPGYKSCNTEYHDFEHTIDALTAVSRLLDGYIITRQKMDDRLAENLLIATLLHDTGYIQESWDKEGTGAKYTASHVERSIAFIKKNHVVFGVDASQLDSISRLIKSTGLTISLDSIPFIDDEEKIAGTILGTADLLGQMSSRIYLEKLLFLYYEFREAGIPGFNTEFDILRKTLDFYEVTKKRFENSYLSSYNFARFHFKERHGLDRNLYLEAIEKNIAYIHKIIEDDTTNFRLKLKRGKWISQDRYNQNSLQ